MPEEDEVEEQNGEPAPKLPQYEEIATEVPEREVDLEEYEGPKTLSEQEEETQQSTDLKAAMRYLIPQYKTPRLNELLQPVMVSRVFPDNYLDLNYLLVMTEIESLETEGGDVDFAGVVTAVQAATSIGYEGRCRIDILEVAGVAHEEEMEKLSKELGI